MVGSLRQRGKNLIGNGVTGGNITDKGTEMREKFSCE